MIATYNFYNGAKIAQTGKACLFVEIGWIFMNQMELKFSSIKWLIQSFPPGFNIFESFLMTDKSWLPVQYLDSDHPLIDLLRFEDPNPFSREMQLLVKFNQDVAKQMAEQRIQTGHVNTVHEVLKSEQVDDPKHKAHMTENERLNLMDGYYDKAEAAEWPQ